MSSAHYQEYLAEKQAYEAAQAQQQQHNLLKQQIRQTVLTRAGGRNAQAGQLEETVEVDDTAEVNIIK
jgi:hypothetical protein